MTSETTPSPADDTPDFVEALSAGDLTWSYRRMVCDDGSMQVREVYTHRTTGAVAGWVGGPVSMLAEDAESLEQLHARFAQALAQPVLVETELPGYAPES